MMHYILSLLIFTPLAFALLMLLVPAHKLAVHRWLSLAGTGLQLLFAGLAVWQFSLAEPDALRGGMHLYESAPWFSLELGYWGTLAVNYTLGLDALSLSLVILTAVVMFIGVISSWNIQKQSKGYFLLYLLLSSSIMGCFLALDFFLFYLFFEFMLLPMYFLIGIWGGPRREYAAIKFFLYTLLGSLLILLVLVGLYVSVMDPVQTGIAAGLLEPGQFGMEAIRRVQVMLSNGDLSSQQIVHSFSFLHMADGYNIIPGSVFDFSGGSVFFGMHARLLAFLALFIGFAIKLPAVPVHTWLPDAHVEAPTPISVVLAGILLKIGGYGLLRIILPIFPEGAVHYAYFMAIVGVVSMLYGALNALAQADLKKLIAYSSVSHMGFVLLGAAALTAEGLAGAAYQMFSHGLISAMLFLIAGVLYDRTHDRLIENYSGLAKQMPAFTALTVVAFFASLGLPGFSGFIAELLVFLGSFASSSRLGLYPHAVTIVALLTLLFTAAYYLWTLQRMFFGAYDVRDKSWHLPDLNLREWSMLLPLALAILIFGLFPQLLLDPLQEMLAPYAADIYQRGSTNLKLLERWVN